MAGFRLLAGTTVCLVLHRATGLHILLHFAPSILKYTSCSLRPTTMITSHAWFQSQPVFTLACTAERVATRTASSYVT